MRIRKSQKSFLLHFLQIALSTTSSLALALVLHTTTTIKTMASTEPVAGVWKRLWEEDPLGDAAGADRDTLVLWSQTPKSGIYVDLRLPSGAPGRSIQDARAAGFKPNSAALEARGGLTNDSSLIDSKLADVIFRQKSFAGYLTYTVGDTTSGLAIEKDKILAELAEKAKENNEALSLCTCFWRRDIDYQPPSGGLDIGVCASESKNSDGSIDLRETGDDASYAEGWHRLPNSADPPFMALQLVSENGVARDGFWVRTGKHFAYAVGRPKDVESTKSLGCHENCVKIKECVGKSLAEAVQSLNSNLKEQLQLIGSYVVAFGDVSDNDGSWTILHSTDPSLVSCNLVGSELSSTCCSKLERPTEATKELEVGDLLVQKISETGAASRTWKVVELDGQISLPLP